MEYDKIFSITESLLFVSGEALSIEKICDIIGIKKSIFCKYIENMKSHYKNMSSGIELVEFNEKLQLVTKSENQDYIQSLIGVKVSSSLSSAAFEVLAIVAYNQPITKRHIDKIRGTDCYYIISNLIRRDLIEEGGRLDLPGKPVCYKTTSNFLKCFGISDLKDLPPMPTEQQLNDEIFHK